MIRRNTARDFRRFAASLGYKLEHHQQRIVRAAFGPEPELVVLLPRGNFKTTTLALLAVHHLLSVPRPAVYCAASSREQARILFEAARDFASHPLVAGEIIARHLELRATDGFMRALAADALKLHGLTPSLAIIDEYHAHPDDQVYTALRTAILKRPGARLVTISTAPESADTPLGRLRARALAQPHVTRRGALTEAHGAAIRLLEWAVPDDVEATPAQAPRANPASGITLAALRDQHEAVSELAWLRFHCNRIAGREGAWLPPGAWQACEGETEFEQGERIWIGADLGGGERSTSAVVYLNDRLHVGCEIFPGESSAVDAAEFIAELAETYTVVEAAYDPWQGALLAETMEQRGLTAVQFPQSDSRMQPASERLHRAVTERRLVHDGHPELAEHVHAALAKTTRRGWRLHRPSDDRPIDAVIALAIALDRAEHVEQPVQLLGWL
jgi:phage terminase large subunit-like protein